jgi:hypothetical protein
MSSPTISWIVNVGYAKVSFYFPRTLHSRVQQSPQGIFLVSRSKCFTETPAVFVFRQAAANYCHMRGEIPPEVCVACNSPRRFSSCSSTDPTRLWSHSEAIKQQLQKRNFTHEAHLFFVLPSDHWTSVIITDWDRWKVKKILKQYIRWAQYYRNVTEQVDLSGNACGLYTLFGRITVRISVEAMTIIKHISVVFLASPDQWRHSTLNKATIAFFQILFNVLFTTINSFESIIARVTDRILN